MQLTHLTIDHLRAIDRLDIDLTDDTGRPRRRLVLLGANGSGKTTILDALAHALQRLGADHDGEFGARPLGAADVQSTPIGAPPPEAALRGTVTIGAALSDAERRTVLRTLPGAPARGILPVVVGDELTRIAGDASSLGSEGVSFLDAARAALLDARPPCVLLPANRGALESSEDVRLRDLVAFEPRQGCLSKARERFAPLAARLALAFAAPKQGDPRGVFARMWKALDKYAPELPKPLDVRGLELWFSAKGRAVPLWALSDGERALLLLFAEVALRAPEDGVVMIDEVEQHLHPRWQLAVVEGLPALVPTAQFIFTTQAPYVAACAPSDVVKVGDWDEHGE
jgi:hypothetical protein